MRATRLRNFILLRLITLVMSVEQCTLWSSCLSYFLIFLQLLPSPPSFRAKYFLSAVFPKPPSLPSTSLGMEEEDKNNVPAINIV